MWATFLRYVAHELEIETKEFKENIRSHFFDTNRVHWQDGIVMLALRRAAS